MHTCNPKLPVNTRSGQKNLVGTNLINQINCLLGFKHLGVGMVEAAREDQADIFFGDQFIQYIHTIAQCRHRHAVRNVMGQMFGGGAAVNDDGVIGFHQSCGKFTNQLFLPSPLR